MRVIYTPEGGSKRSWPVNFDNPAWDITYGTEKATGWPWGEFADKLSKGSVIGLRALIWVLRKRDEPRLDIEAVTITFDEVELEDDEEAEAPDPKESRPSSKKSKPTGSGSSGS